MVYQWVKRAEQEGTFQTIEICEESIKENNMLNQPSENKYLQMKDLTSFFFPNTKRKEKKVYNRLHKICR